MWCAPGNHTNMCHICAKELLDTNFKLRSYLQNINFLMKLPQISHIHKNHNFYSIIGSF